MSCRAVMHCIASQLITTVSYHITDVDKGGSEKLTLSETNSHLVLCVSWVSLYRM